MTAEYLSRCRTCCGYTAWSGTILRLSVQFRRSIRTTKEQIRLKIPEEYLIDNGVLNMMTRWSQGGNENEWLISEHVRRVCCSESCQHSLVLETIKLCTKWTNCLSSPSSHCDYNTRYGMLCIHLNRMPYPTSIQVCTPCHGAEQSFGLEPRSQLYCYTSRPELSQPLQRRRQYVSIFGILFLLQDILMR